MVRPFLSAVGGLALPFLAGCNDTGEPAALSSPSITNLGLASAPGELAGEGELWLFAAREFDSAGRDLNGDGDAFDRVVHVQDLATGTTRNTGLALETRGPAPILRVRDGLAVFAVSEPGNGGIDLDGDGDASDTVLQVIDAAGSSRNLGLALARATPPAVGDGLVA